MDKRIEDYLHLYLGCEGLYLSSYGVHGKKQVKAKFVGITSQRKLILVCYDKYGKEWGYDVVADYHEFVPAFRPPSDMTAEEAVKLCSIYSPEAFGDYRFSKWVAVRGEANFCYNVTNEKSDMSFHVDIKEMHIKVYEDGNDTYPSLENHTYFTEYLRMGFDLFGLIPAGLAIDKSQVAAPVVKFP